jgi:hypothetical protein
LKQLFLVCASFIVVSHFFAGVCLGSTWCWFDLMWSIMYVLRLACLESLGRALGVFRYLIEFSNWFFVSFFCFQIRGFRNGTFKLNFFKMLLKAYAIFLNFWSFWRPFIKHIPENNPKQFFQVTALTKLNKLKIHPQLLHQKQLHQNFFSFSKLIKKTKRFFIIHDIFYKHPHNQFIHIFTSWWISLSFSFTHVEKQRKQNRKKEKLFTSIKSQILSKKR